MPSLEHTLFILLLLVGLINSRVLQGFWWWIVGFFLTLALISPVIPVTLPWAWLAGLFIPLLFWQTAQRLINARLSKEIKPVDVSLWIGVTLALSLALLFFGNMILSSALLLGFLITSMVWRATEGEQSPSMLGQFGPLMLAYLLVEVAPAVNPPNDTYLRVLFGGAAVGLVTGFAGVYISERIPAGWKRDTFSVGQGYFTYLVTLLLGLSAVAGSITSIVIYAAYGARRGLWESGYVQPRPLDSRPVFVIIVFVLAVVAWQTHIWLTPVLILDLLIGLVIVALAMWIGRLFNSNSFQEDHSLGKVVARAGFLLAPALLLWPREILLEPEPLAIAFVAAVATVYGAHITLTPLLDLYRSTNEARVKTRAGDYLFTHLRVKDLMITDFKTISPETRISQLAGLLLKERKIFLVVVDGEHQVRGLVNEADLFLKEKRIPRSILTYPALFGEHVFAEEFAEAYAEMSDKYIVSDILTEISLWLTEESLVSEAIQMLYSMNLDCLPVLKGDPKSGAILVGLLTRSHILHYIWELHHRKQTRTMVQE